MLQDPAWVRSGRTDRGRDGCRVPLPWTADGPAFGFSPEGAEPWLPIPTGWGSLSRAAQQDDPDSTLSLYREAIRLRATLPAMRGGVMHWLDSPDDTLVFAREPGFVCAVNAGDGPVRLPLAGEVLAASAPVEQSEDGLVLPADTAVWLRPAGPSRTLEAA